MFDVEDGERLVRQIAAVAEAAARSSIRTGRVAAGYSRTRRACQDGFAPFFPGRATHFADRDLTQRRKGAK
ncbi:MAG: hypothetical protein KY476_23105, partial [Planctomycetes bacterium]|nr:hypothetical protein [Planctomycetota bacterium]